VASPDGKVAGSFLGVVCGGCAIAMVTARMLIAHAQYSAWERISKVEPTGFYQGRFLVVTVALLATPILIVFFSTRLRDDSLPRWTTAAGGLFGLGVGMGSWFLLLGLRTPPTYLFVWTGALVALAGTVSGAIGLRAAVRATGGRADLGSSEEWLKKRRLLKTGAFMALLGSVGIVVSSLFAGSSTNALDPRNSFLAIAAQLAPAIVALAFAASLKFGLENKWEVAAGAWLGIGLSVGLAYV
jgi:hypothetical protein